MQTVQTEQTAPIPTARVLVRSQRGMTILEIMIVLAIIALVMGFLVGPRIMKMFGDSKKEVAALDVKRYVDEAYPLWARQNPTKPCPGGLAELNEFTNKGKSIADPWGTDYVMLCGQNLPPGARGLAVYSAGEDMKPNTGDDVKSWE
jgi:prepilin-type N-terminal cleavage/methylation domain-containing protein